MFYMLNRSIILKSCGNMLSISTGCRVHSRIYLLSCKSLGDENWPTNIYSHW